MDKHQFLCALEKQFEGKCQWNNDMLLINFQYESSNNLSAVPITVAIDNTMHCHLMTFGLGNISEDKAFQACSVCNVLNRNDSISATFYLDKDFDFDACYKFLILPDDTFVDIYAPVVISKFAKDIDVGYGVIRNALSQMQ